MEDILEERICASLGQMYGKDNIDQIMKIFFLRSMIYFNKTDVNGNEYLDFLIEELNLPDCDIYQFEGEEISKKNFYRSCSFENIMDNFIFRHLESFEKSETGQLVPKEEILKKMFLRFKEVVDKKYKYERKRSPYYKERYCYSLLQELYKEFSIIVQSPSRIKGLKYPLNHNDFKLTFDEYSQRYYFHYFKEHKKISEEELEAYLYAYPEALGIEGLKILHRQHKVKNGIVDLLGEDKDGNKVVIELKVKKRPKDLIWQLQAYTEDLRDICKEKVRAVAVTPPLDKSIVSQLKKMDCELYYFYHHKNKLTFEKQVL